ncbi:Hypothetical protein SMAX5B_007642 [Scophthalmus maximus]|uniref:Uncharacterized protein n=1 Tax=Scophthalmus maximus TaxID=52904 RepID=A0A2U9CMD5_SCOMX|nr:Hypothetical protein SMAX5B_007642 [Scophthalmus maximus]
MATAKQEDDGNSNSHDSTPLPQTVSGEGRRLGGTPAPLSKSRTSGLYVELTSSGFSGNIAASVGSHLPRQSSEYPPPPPRRRQQVAGRSDRTLSGLALAAN